VIVPGRLSRIGTAAPDLVARATLLIDTPGPSLIEFTREAAQFLQQSGASDGLLTAFVRHTSASLITQENADPDVRRDLLTALQRLAPKNAGWVHETEGPDDMPAHIKAMLTGVSLSVPVTGGRMVLGTWQGLYLIEHRRAPHAREIVLLFVGSRGLALPSGETGALIL
jgi:secondary thiamine-phosphate synthase enzyme